ncbi:uncharacterized protein K02A2.6-like [Topomyia yanbarensis]|uniref:uncharacterized protein K02A2.6-like n=1 Tax=Topomyia yanbarensis TaxID=2498891 RepID=UPI00273C9371|nr:uncharacterized protein K02A2.6-like [Topomyia yanbarensis]
MFSHIDLSDAYLQVEVDEESRKLITINTHKGLYRFNRLSPGVKSAPGAFQQIMDAMLSGLSCTSPYLDDILVGGRTAEEHKQNLYRVLQQLKEYGFTVKFEKCRFFMRQVKYLGQLLDTDGIRPDPDKVEVIVTCPHLIMFPRFDRTWARLTIMGNISAKCAHFANRWMNCLRKVTVSSGLMLASVPLIVLRKSSNHRSC